MFGWGSVSSALNTDLSVPGKLTKNNLEVFKTQQDSTLLGPYSKTLRLLSGQFAIPRQTLLLKTMFAIHAWISSAESKLATVAEYNRINDTIRDSKQSELQTELTPGRSRNSDI